MHQPATAAMIGLSVTIPTVGTQRHSSGRSVTSAPAEKARPPAPVRIATRCADRSNAANTACNSMATALLIAFSFSGRLMLTIETDPRSSMLTTLMAWPFAGIQRVTLTQSSNRRGFARREKKRQRRYVTGLYNLKQVLPRWPAYIDD